MRKKIMTNLIKSLPFIGRKYRVMLKKAKITTTGEILEHGICRTSRGNLANELGISERLISKWVNLADLLRVKGIGKRYLKLLDKIGIGNLNKLSKQDPDNILQKIDSLDQEDLQKIKRKPSKKTIRRWIEESRKTGKIVQNLSDDLDILEVDIGRKIFLVHDMALDLIGSKEWETIINWGNEIKNKCFFEIIQLGEQINELREGIDKQKKSDITERFSKNKKIKELKESILKEIKRPSDLKKIEAYLLNAIKKQPPKTPVENAKILDLEKKVYYNFFLFFTSDFLILIGRSGLSMERKDEYTLDEEAIQEKLKHINSSMPLSYHFLKRSAGEIKKQSLLDVIKLMKYTDQVNSMFAKLMPHTEKIEINKLFNRTYTLYKKIMREVSCKFYLFYTIYGVENRLKNLIKNVNKKNWQTYTKRKLKFLIFPKKKDIIIINQLSSYNLMKNLYRRL
ncbi:MAG: DUF4332 domain-containing protein [Hadesarchaea archaeon]|nr:DUF4332 domain-containing protein [Hadesarchaea archaeon]